MIMIAIITHECQQWSISTLHINSELVIKNIHSELIRFQAFQVTVPGCAGNFIIVFFRYKISTESYMLHLI